MDLRTGANRTDNEPPADFVAAVESLRRARLRPEITVEETPAPKRMAPFAFALTADVAEEAATGRLVLLHDPDGHDAWHGKFRLVTYVRAALEPEIAADPFLPGVGWAWLTDALAGQGAQFTAPSGTVTRVASESFGGMADEAPTADIEIRASWTPVGRDMTPHVLAWGEVLTTAAGLLPLPAGVVAIPSQRGATRR
ncbi:MAG TPA: DUF3000 domain-containing protein [Jiangellaceae bacterium]|nr:DUF3000 domain-containing protein [Jiangellaceae bacterium]